MFLNNNFNHIISFVILDTCLYCIYNAKQTIKSSSQSVVVLKSKHISTMY